jgi:hypothetical protein
MALEPLHHEGAASKMELFRRLLFKKNKREIKEPQ